MVTALVVRLLTGRFIWEYDPTLEAAYRHHTTVDDEPTVMHIYDTAGQEEGCVSEAHARWGDGFLLAFSLTDRRSFTTLAAIHAAVAAARQTPNFSCVVVANKTDLGHLAEVSEDEASEMAGELGASLFLTSACDGGPAIQAAFTELHRDVVRRRWSRRRRSSAKTVIEGFYKMFSR
ncbi:Ras-related and estrogen-regulated growth inhibitor-like 4 [Homarus americanus]|uniref:small monomeric GTPase n=1 Tax=Homarus americanus TaxID=6706 RepID=A0A8J5NDZ0_HOMAM|nr:Ras-related and estrogen-regulated growth inhibitor-like 4 [Homarus americanus]